MRCRIIIGCLLTLAMCAGAQEADIRQMINNYLYAYARNEIPVVRQYLPTEEKNLFGPYLFAGLPVLTGAKVDENQALVEFSAKVLDPQFPQKGGILCRQIDGVWLVRQVLFYDKIPAIFSLPKRSVTDADRANEARVLVVARQFTQAWHRGDNATLTRLWHHWPDHERDPIKGISLSQLTLTQHATDWNDTFTRYSAKLTYRWGILSYSMTFNGGLLLVKENGKLRVRGNIMVFYF